MHLAIGILDANVIFENTQMGVLISSASQLTLRKNFIFGNAAAGVQIDDDATGTLKFNKIMYNGSYGLHLASVVRRRQRFLEGKHYFRLDPSMHLTRGNILITANVF